MSSFAYVALDNRGHQTRGTLDVEGQIEAIARIKEMGFFPTRIVEVKSDRTGSQVQARTPRAKPPRGLLKALRTPSAVNLFGSGVKTKQLCAFTRQLATLTEAGMPLLRGLRLMREQERPGGLNAIMQSLAESIEGGSTLSESLAQHPKVFNPLYINMVKAGEVGGVLEVVLKRLADFMEKSQKIKGKIIAASFYPVAVLVVACAIMGLLLALVVPKFAEVFQGLTNGQPLPTFTLFVFGISEFVTRHIVLALSSVAALVIAAQIVIRTPPGRHFFDRFKLSMPVFGQIIRKLAITRFTRTLGTLASSGVPILQSLMIVKETAGNVIVRDAVAAIHDSIKQGETIAAPMRASGVFPALVAGMVEIGEQTGALPEMLMKIADTYEEEVDNAVTAMTSLLEPIMIVFLAVVVGSIVIALFLPIIHLIDFDPARGAGEP